MRRRTPDLDRRVGRAVAVGGAVDPAHGGEVGAAPRQDIDDLSEVDTRRRRPTGTLRRMVAARHPRRRRRTTRSPRLLAPSPGVIERLPGFQLYCGAPLDVPHVGIVFVHGIGSQAAGESSSTGAARSSRCSSTREPSTRRRAIRSSTSSSIPARSSRFIELRLPEATPKEQNGLIPERRVMTEAWWAERVRPPAFGDMAEWLGTARRDPPDRHRDLPRRRSAHDPRLRPAVRPEPLERGSESSARSGMRLAAAPLCSAVGTPTLCRSPRPRPSSRNTATWASCTGNGLGGPTFRCWAC